MGAADRATRGPPFRVNKRETSLSLRATGQVRRLAGSAAWDSAPSAEHTNAARTAAKGGPRQANRGPRPLTGGAQGKRKCQGGSEVRRGFETSAAFVPLVLPGLLLLWKIPYLVQTLSSASVYRPSCAPQKGPVGRCGGVCARMQDPDSFFGGWGSPPPPGPSGGCACRAVQREELFNTEALPGLAGENLRLERGGSGGAFPPAV